jgi:KipI family sensor histidine kinase inhibitor
VRVLPSGSAGLLLECGDLDEVLGLYGVLQADPPAGVLDVVPAARTVLLVLDPGATTPERVRALVEDLEPGDGPTGGADEESVVEVPVVYDGGDLDDVAEILGCDRDEVVRRHTSGLWTVAFCGFAPGFGYLTADQGEWSIPRRDSPRTKVPAGSVALAGEFSAVYPRETPGGWQLIGRTDLEVFDLDRDPPALLTPETRVRFVEAGS